MLPVTVMLGRKVRDAFNFFLHFYRNLKYIHKIIIIFMIKRSNINFKV